MFAILTTYKTGPTLYPVGSKTPQGSDDTGWEIIQAFITLNKKEESNVRGH